MASLRDLVRTIFPLARPVGSAALDAARGEREVTWVRVLKARVPAFDALEPRRPRDRPGPRARGRRPEPTQVDELAAALARARVPAVVLVDGDGGAESVEALGEAAADAGLTVLRVGRTDPIALERSVIGFLVNRRAELDRRAPTSRASWPGSPCWVAGSTSWPRRSGRSSGGPSSSRAGAATRSRSTRRPSCPGPARP